MSRSQARHVLRVTAEMVASVLSVEVAEGESVQAGQTMMTVESMKMEMPIVAPAGGTVAEVGPAVGDIVQEGDLLVAISR